MDIKTKRAVRILAVFLILMVSCTILSRAAASVLVAQVQVKKPDRGKLSYTGSGEGSVVPVQEKLVFLWPGQQVEWAADAGSTVKAGDCLVKFRMEYLQQAIEGKQAELTQLELQAQQQQISARGNARVPSAERARQALADAQRGLQEAQQRAADAQAEYDQFQAAPLQPQTEELHAAGESTGYPASGGQAASSGISMPGGQGAASSGYSMSGGQAASAGISMSGAQTAAGTSSGIAENMQGTAGNENAAAQNPDSSRQQELENALGEARAKVEAAQQSVIQAQNEYNFALKEDAAQDVNEANAVESAQLGAQALNVQVDTARKALEQLIAYQNAGGKICAEQDCTVLESGIQAGIFTTGAEVLVTGSGGWRLRGIASEKDREKLKPGVEAEIRLGSGRKQTVKIESVGAESNPDAGGGEDPNAPQQLLTCWYALMPENTAADSGDSFEWTVKAASEKEYEQLIPLSALREETGGAYCLVISEEETMLGTVQTARRVPVTVLEKDSENAAVESTLKDTDKVIVSSEKYVQEGDRVRIKP